MKKIVIAITFSIINIALFANDGYYIIQGTGGMVMPVKNSAITMERAYREC